MACRRRRRGVKHAVMKRSVAGRLSISRPRQEYVKSNVSEEADGSGSCEPRYRGYESQERLGPGGGRVGHRVRPVADTMRLRAGDRPFGAEESTSLRYMTLYSLMSGFVALLAGGLVSFAVAPPAGKIAIWGVVTGITAIAAGVGYESRFMRNWFLALSWVFRQWDRF
jgi:hypothetical protein